MGCFTTKCASESYDEKMLWKNLNFHDESPVMNCLSAKAAIREIKTSLKYSILDV